MEIIEMKSFLKLAGLTAVLLLLFSGPVAFAQAVLRPGDTIEIRLAGVPTDEIGQFSAPYTIDETGALNLPYIGSVKVGGLQSNEAQVTIENKLKSEKIYTHPTVTINIGATSRFVNIGGAVRGPGRIGYTADLTLMSAINAAGGFNDFADKKRVKLIRSGTSQQIDTRKLSKDPSKDFKVLPGDQIEVPQSLW